VLWVAGGKIEVRYSDLERLPLSPDELRLAARTGSAGFRHRDAGGQWWRVRVRARPAGTVVRLGRATDYAALTERELDVAGLVARGWSNERVAAGLGIAVRTVRSHVESSLGKLDCPNRTALARTALAQDLDTLAARHVADGN
jgi:DNA-binding NarL/FixJ family response regulator